MNGEHSNTPEVRPTEPRAFRKKPVVIHAMRVPANPGDCDALCEWLEDRADYLVLVDHILLITLEGEMRANVGDWIIRGVKGEFYPCKPDIFEATYEPA